MRSRLNENTHGHGFSERAKERKFCKGWQWVELVVGGYVIYISFPLSIFPPFPPSYLQYSNRGYLICVVHVLGFKVRHTYGRWVQYVKPCSDTMKEVEVLPQNQLAIGGVAQLLISSY
ncbi:unnamed protein product [Prunus armeniaca]